MSAVVRCAAITPYYKESRSLLERCISSVKRQTVATDHFLISDGHSQDWIDSEVLRHIKLGVPHRDYGNTPRGLGGLLAVSEQYDAIFFLDADNWIEPTHVQHCLEAATAAFGSPIDCDVVLAKRTMRRPDETILPVADEPGHVDTSCFFFLTGAFHLLSLWVTMPRFLSARGDRFFYTALRARELRTATTSVPTVNYQCLWASIYKLLGEDVPPDAKENVGHDYRATVKLMTERELDILARLTGGLYFSRR